MGAVSDNLVPNGAFEDGTKNWRGRLKVVSAMKHHNMPVVLVDDDSDRNSLYAMSVPIKIDPAKVYRFSGWLKTSDDNIKGSGIYLRVFDRNNKTIKAFALRVSSPGQWYFRELLIKPSDWPPNVDHVCIMLTPYFRASNEIAKAWYSNILLKETDLQQELSRRQLPAEWKNDSLGSKDMYNIRKGLFAKSSSNADQYDMPANTIDKKETAWRPDANDKHPWLELSWLDFAVVGGILIHKTPESNIKQFKIYYWDDYNQKWILFKNTQAPRTKGEWLVTDIDRSGFSTRRVKLEFETSDIGIKEVRFFARNESEKWSGNWIWLDDNQTKSSDCYFRKKFTVNGELERCSVQFSADDDCTLYINGHAIEKKNIWSTLSVKNIKPYLKQGENIFAAKVHNDGSYAGFILEVDLVYVSGKGEKIFTDNSWVWSNLVTTNWIKNNYDDSKWRQSISFGTGSDSKWPSLSFINNSAKPQLLVSGNAISKTLTAGSELDLNIEFRVDSELRYPLLFNLKQGDLSYFSIDLMADYDLSKYQIGETIQINKKIKLSKYLCHGTYTFSLTMPYREIVFAKDKTVWNKKIHIINTYRPKQAVAELKTIDSIPTIYVDGKPVWDMGCLEWTSRPEWMHHRAFGSVGIPVIYILANPKLLDEKNFDFGVINQKLTEALEANPDAKIIIWSTLRDWVPEWFRQKYPEELAVLDSGEVRRNASLASEKWRNLTNKVIRKLIEHINESPFAASVICYYMADGEDGQWYNYWNETNKLTQDNTLGDYSKPMLEYFRHWLKNKYKTNRVLQQAWKLPTVTFETAKIPSRKQRIASGLGYFRDPARNAPSIDFDQATSEMVADQIISIGKVIKEASRGKTLCGVNYSCYKNAGAYFIAQSGGRLNSRKLIDSPYLDLFNTPISYVAGDRDLGGPTTIDAPFPASLRLRNKRWVNQADSRSHLKNPTEYAYSVRCANQFDQILAREFSKAFCAGAGIYWFSMPLGGRNWYDDRQTVETMGQLNKIAQTGVKGNLSSVSEVAVVYSEKALFYQQYPEIFTSKNPIAYETLYNQHRQIAYMGAPFDEYFASDFLNANMPDYKFYIFMNTYYLTDEEQKAIKSKLNKNGTTALWLYAPGFVEDNKLSIENCQALTGIKLAYLPEAHSFKVKVKSNDFLKSGININLSYGLPEKNRFNERITLAPVFYCIDPEAEKLAWISGLDKPGLVRKKVGNTTMYYSSVPSVPAEILRVIASQGGVHIYIKSNDAFYACHDYVAIHTNKTPGKRIIYLKDKLIIKEVYPVQGKPIITNQIGFNAEKPETRIFQVIKQHQ
jgi:hypothetical protein